MIYFPITAQILTPGHILALRWLEERDDVLIGLLTDEALTGYKEVYVPYEERLFVLEAITKSKIVPQDTLYPGENLALYSCDELASGDGFEEEETGDAEELGVSLLDIDIPKDYSSSQILERACKSFY